MKMANPRTTVRMTAPQRPHKGFFRNSVHVASDHSGCALFVFVFVQHALPPSQVAGGILTHTG